MKRILLAVSGLNPQVITEALYCLWQDRRCVDSIHIITTRVGKELLLARLFSGGTGKLYRFFEEYGIDTESVDVNPGNIHTVTDENGVEIDDIVTQEDNERLLLLCLEQTFKLTRHGDDTSVYFLVAGGRKTMTSCLTLAAQLYGRQQDRIYHVLVSPEFESSREFWYPPKESVQIELRDKNGECYFKQTHYARLQLVPIPFVSVRSRLSETLLAKPHAPGTLLTSLVKDQDRMLEISLQDATVTFGDVQMDMHPARLALFAFFCDIKKQCSVPDKPNCRSCTTCFISVDEVFRRQERITSFYRQIIDRGGSLAEMSDTGIACLSAENFNSYKSKIKRDLLACFGAMASDLQITSVGRKPDTRYGIMLERRRITIIW